MKKIELNVKGMVCGGCENRVKNSILEMKEVKEVFANHETGKVMVVLKKDLTNDIKNTIITKIENLDFEVKK